MVLQIHEKLVRDRVPEIITRSGRTPRVRTLDAAEARLALFNKLVEEANELRAAPTSEAACQELADLLEVVRALAAEHDIGWDAVNAAADNKLAERGGFTDRLFLLDVEGLDYDGE
jgi:predicted house-cleaning noncanonical NTP pyrophosphatase (MazG superfamily)